MFAIMNIKTGKFLYGTDYCYNPPHQRTSYNRVRTYDNLAVAKVDYRHRNCGKDYRIVCLKPAEVERIIPFDVDGAYEHTTEDWRITK